jgi:hypothetical protein
VSIAFERARVRAATRSATEPELDDAYARAGC